MSLSADRWRIVKAAFSELAELPADLRAIRLAFPCPFTGRPLDITAPVDEFLERFGFALEDEVPDAESA